MDSTCSLSSIPTFSRHALLLIFIIWFDSGIRIVRAQPEVVPPPTAPSKSNHALVERVKVKIDNIGTVRTRRDLSEELQSDLALLGYDPGSIDGFIGPKTKVAIREFLADHSKPVESESGPRSAPTITPTSNLSQTIDPSPTRVKVSAPAVTLYTAPNDSKKGTRVESRGPNSDIRLLVGVSVVGTIALLLVVVVGLKVWRIYWRKERNETLGEEPAKRIIMPSSESKPPEDAVSAPSVKAAEVDSHSDFEAALLAVFRGDGDG